MAAEDLRRAYLDLMLEEPGTPLDAFLERVAAGEFGRQPPEAVEQFLRGVERDMLASIRTHAEASPGLAGEVEDRIQETQAEIADLIRRYARTANG